MSEKKIGFFAKYLTLWVASCIVLGVFIGVLFPQVPKFLEKMEYANISIPVAVLIWLMIYPMMLKVDFKSIINAGKKPKGLIITLVLNWLIKPFTMYLIAWFFLKVIFKAFIIDSLATDYIAGMVLLGAAPCTAMVFVWSYLSDGDPGYTVIQVAVNDLIILLPLLQLWLCSWESAMYKCLWIHFSFCSIIRCNSSYCRFCYKNNSP